MEQKPNRNRFLYTGVGISIGAVLGAGVGWAFHHVALGIALGVVIGLLYAYLLPLPFPLPEPRAPTRPRPRRPARAMSQEETALYGKLLSRVLGDREVADNLIEYERRLAPNASKTTLIRNAIDRLDYDRSGRG